MTGPAGRRSGLATLRVLLALVCEATDLECGGGPVRGVMRRTVGSVVVTDRLETERGAGARASGVRRRRRAHGVRALALALLPLLALAGALPSPAVAQNLAGALAQPDSSGQLILDADELIYDNDRQVVTASGAVQLVYGGYRVVAQRVSYNQATRRVTAAGDVEIIEPGGNRIYADEIDITDDFGDGFVNALRVERPDNSRFAAESAERFAGEKTVFNHGVYTACEQCKERPEKPLTWRIKAERVILNGKTKTISYERARFELFGLPIAYLPYFRHSSEDTERATGFLFPRAGYAEDLGVWYRQPYFWASSDTTDLTFTSTGYSNQGFLSHARWRQQFENGQYALYGAYIHQMNPNDFAAVEDREEDRWMLATTGRYDFNSRWHAGWSWLVQSDRNFALTYDLPVFGKSNIVNTAYLRGLHDLSYFDLALLQFRSQSTADLVNEKQAFARPLLDYNAVRLSPAFGQLSLDVNVQSLERDAVSTFGTRVTGLEGTSTRASADLAWTRSWTTSGGLTITPSASLRGDWTEADTTGAAIDQDGAGRFMPTAGLEVRYPLLFRAGTSSHVVEPIAQIFARPDLAYSGTLPNEDSQSLVFDPTALFERDKFSGYDRIEEGTRANVGLRYSGVFDNGWTLSGLVGQSYHLAGRNPYARTDDPVRTGVASGLEDDISDYVLGIGAAGPSPFGLQAHARFGREELDVRRGEAQLSYNRDRFGMTGTYTYTASVATVAQLGDLHQFGATARLRLSDNWTTFGSVNYDIANDSFLSNGVGLTYHDECFTFTLAFRQTRNAADDDFNQFVGFKFSLRTIGNAAYDVALDQFIEEDDAPDF